MLLSLNTDMYADGYTINEFDCGQIPVAGACSAYGYDYYYYAGFVMSIVNNWDNEETGFQTFDEFINYSSRALSVLSLKFQLHKVESKEDFLSLINEMLSRKIPIVIKVKYNALYYHRYYMSKAGDDEHILLIDSYNTDTKIITVRDTTFLRGTAVLKTDSDPLFPLALTEDSVWDILRRTCNHEVYDANERLIFSIIQEDKSKIGELQLLDYAIESCKRKKNLFAEFIRNQSNNMERIVQQFEDLNRRFVGSLGSLFKILEMWLTDREKLDKVDEVKQFADKYLKQRKVIFFSLYKNSLVGNAIKSEKLERNISTVEEEDAALAKLLETIRNSCFQAENDNYSTVNLNRFYNNKAFWDGMSSVIEADLSGTGLCFCMPEYSKLVTEDNWTNGIDESQYDNISCEGQKIEFTKGKYKKILILACSEYGSYKESISSYLSEQQKDVVSFWVSDFYMNPIFGERTFCYGETYQKKESSLEKESFLSRIFKYDIRLNGEEIDSIVLPKRKNIHIFAIQLIS